MNDEKENYDGKGCEEVRYYSRVKIGKKMEEWEILRKDNEKD